MERVQGQLGVSSAQRTSSTAKHPWEGSVKPFHAKDLVNSSRDRSRGETTPVEKQQAGKAGPKGA